MQKPIADAELAARQLGATLLRIPKGGHLNGSAGYTELPEALATLAEMMQ